jgi:hypothetical protein
MTRRSSSRARTRRRKRRRTLARRRRRRAPRRRRRKRRQEEDEDEEDEESDDEEDEEDEDSDDDVDQGPMIAVTVPGRDALSTGRVIQISVVGPGGRRLRTVVHGPLEARAVVHIPCPSSVRAASAAPGERPSGLLQHWARELRVYEGRQSSLAALDGAADAALKVRELREQDERWQM